MKDDFKSDFIALRRLHLGDEVAFFNAIEATQTSDPHFAHFYLTGMKFDHYLEILNQVEDGIEVPEGFVREILLFAFLDQTIVGRLTLRPELNDSFRQFGGSIGYKTVPQFRRAGIATEMLKQGLRTAKELGLTKVLLTCLDDNIGSLKTIEKNQGIYESKLCELSSKKVFRRYWIETK